jgi:hypothetical protein
MADREPPGEKVRAGEATAGSAHTPLPVEKTTPGPALHRPAGHG